ncbi:uroporphyrinogen decarboxylase family protein [Desulfosporosinus sp. BICA1-9]|uniref:uroporphyrinogen decarboxylase family protein n=1 Tax=Desulfosporosinus sp. BICA1-9 TaxID=1531958 RepID=UPI00054C6D13|nr:uroporphyrinogen decarboxylase family protein [Desulfosporosinus sp. BICA1-9]KJS48874.1 MAG: uroporphyrinogen decarboxylase [Peptococcaceae bacterium BRH_c23]KJS85777.1 MAG: uroporphyrinogen decarboxylase [Desulfosporosinus sp. BICA1-9]HBW34283.1 uroporphyrinogen decarboxylase [Desulfosporosinus sp.]
MTKIERILAATRFEWVDRIPNGEFYLEDGFVSKLLGLKEKVRFEDRVKACELCGLDALAFSPSPSQVDKALVWEGLEQWRKETDFFIFAIIDGPFQGAAKLFSSFTDYLLAIARRDPVIPELVAKAIAENIARGLNALVSGANGIIIADDIAYQGGTFISPTALRQDFFPGLKDQVDVLRAQKAPVFFHADGNLLPVLSDLVNSGVDGLHSLDFSSLANIAKAKVITEKSLCLMGGYDLGWFGEETRRDRAQELLAVTAKGGGYIFGTSAGIVGSDLEVKEVLDVYQYVQSYALKEL